MLSGHPGHKPLNQLHSHLWLSCMVATKFWKVHSKVLYFVCSLGLGLLVWSMMTIQTIYYWAPLLLPKFQSSGCLPDLVQQRIQSCKYKCWIRYFWVFEVKVFVRLWLKQTHLSLRSASAIHPVRYPSMKIKFARLIFHLPSHSFKSH